MACALLIPLAYSGAHPWLWGMLLLAPFAVKLTKQLCGREGAALNPLLGATGKFLLAFAALYCVGWLL